jgi:hypothetical protein
MSSKRSKRKTKPTSRAARRPAVEETPALHFSGMADSLPVTWILHKSYVLSMLWAWYSQVRLQPRVSIPIPRLFSYRDP